MLRINNEPTKGTWAQSEIYNFLFMKQNFVCIKDSIWTIKHIIRNIRVTIVTIVLTIHVWESWLVCTGISVLRQDCPCVYI